MVPSQSQLLGPRVAATGESDGLGLNHVVWMSACVGEEGCSFSRVIYASIRSCSCEVAVGVPLMGNKRSSMARSAEFLNTQISRTCGSLQLEFVLWKVISRIMDIKGVMPLPPLTNTNNSCLNKLKVNIEIQFVLCIYMFTLRLVIVLGSFINLHIYTWHNINTTKGEFQLIVLCQLLCAA